MTGATPLYGWTYPTGVDRLDAAVTTIPQSMATDIENTLAALFAGGVPGAGWANLALAANWSQVAGYGVGTQTRYTKYGSRVYVDGYGIRATSIAAAGSTVLTLPVGFRPAAKITRPTVINNGGTLSANLLDIATTGLVTTGLAVPVGAAMPLVFDFPVN